jgi:hypothetical protein
MLQRVGLRDEDGKSCREVLGPGLLLSTKFRCLESGVCRGLLVYIGREVVVAVC